jgi:hypothetical protein
MTTAIHTPTAAGKFVELSARTYRKQVLPKGSIQYKGRTITFDDAYLTELANTFTSKAFDQVGFLLAPDDNSHTMDPERFRAEVTALENDIDGLYAVVKFPSDEAAKAVLDNPKLGVSARIIEDYTREADGKHFGPTVQHVLGTLDPRVTGLKPWEAVSLSNPEVEVLDLSESTYEKEATVPDDDKTPKLTDERRSEFDAYLKELEQLDPAKSGDKPVDDKTGGADADLDAELEKMLKESLDLEGAALSAEARKSIDLANATAESARTETARIREELDLANFAREKAQFISDGVPPAMVELATPLLLGAEHVIDLANGTKVDAGDIARKLLTEYAGMVDLSRETKASVASPVGDATKSVLDSWEAAHPQLTK